MYPNSYKWSKRAVEPKDSTEESQYRIHLSKQPLHIIYKRDGNVIRFPKIYIMGGLMLGVFFSTFLLPHPPSSPPYHQCLLELDLPRAELTNFPCSKQGLMRHKPWSTQTLTYCHRLCRQLEIVTMLTLVFFLKKRLAQTSLRICPPSRNTTIFYYRITLLQQSHCCQYCQYSHYFYFCNYCLYCL